ncbi:zinc ribbon domain-containing protein [Clostridium sp. UBA4548]|uniref:zinc ribbon domain-containing protein n=1 Tax=Clostridium sp. UBA4548 TaxID=1946361 RepID=UPI0025BA31B0|nr:zinc ribbon domain-containing protein [Clostridium sp. UBA4548]
MEKNFECLRCKSEMEYLKEYRFDSQDNNRGLFSAFFDVEEHLIFNIYVCPNCRHTEFFYNGTLKGLDY